MSDHVEPAGGKEPIGRRAKLLASMIGAFALLPAITLKAQSTDEAAATGWAELEIVDVAEQPWDASSPYGRIKTVFARESGNLKFIEIPPTWTTGLPARGGPGNEIGAHYHDFSEWAYILGGDYVIYEPISPYQRNPIQHRWVEGTWLDRPPYSLHSGDWATGGIRRQNPATLLLFAEGDTPNVFLDSEDRQPVLHAEPDPNVPDYRSISFESPLIVSSGSALEWEEDTQIEGRLVKWLSDDPEGGFRAQLVKVPPGWSHPEGAHMSYFESAHRLRYILYGDLQISLHDDPDSEGEAMRLEETDFIYQPPRSLWAYDAGPVTENGAVWIEITYANGLARSEGPIERASEITAND